MAYQNDDGGAELEVLTPGVVESLERASIDMQISTAKKFPRGSMLEIKKRMVEFATMDTETSEKCFYTLKRQDADGSQKLIQGPSVRLAEIAITCFKNVRAGARITDNDGRSITAQGVCHDLENNVFISMEARRSIVTKKGKTYGQDMQNTVSNAGAAVAFRNAVFKVIPAALIQPAYEAAKKHAVGNGPILGRWQKAIARFAGFNVKEPMLLAFLEKKAQSDITDEDIGNLIGLYNSIKDGEITVEQAFEHLTDHGSAEAAKNVADQKIADEQAKQEAAKQQSSSADAKTEPEKPTETAKKQREPGDDEGESKVAEEKKSSPPGGLFGGSRR